MLIKKEEPKTFNGTYILLALLIAAIFFFLAVHDIKVASAATLPPDKQDWQELGTMPRTVYGDVQFEVLENSVSPDGAQLLIRAWNEYSDRIAFGKDCDVDMERFIFVGQLPVTYVDKSQIPKIEYDELGYERLAYPRVYDPIRRRNDEIEQAILENSGCGEGKIIPGKIGSTIIIYYTTDGADGGGHSYDLTSTEDWAGVRDTPKTFSSYPYVDINQETSPYYQNYGTGGVSFDLSTSIAACDDVTAVSLSLYGKSKYIVGTWPAMYVNSFGWNPADPSSVVLSDFNIGTKSDTKFDDSGIKDDDWDASGWNTLNYNSSGIAAVQSAVGGWFSTILRDETYQLADTEPTPHVQNYEIYLAAQAATVEPAKLTVTIADYTCGDGSIDGCEACDDGNNDDGDGCSSTCTVEEGYSCVGEPSVCTMAGPTEDDIPIRPVYWFVNGIIWSLFWIWLVFRTLILLWRFFSNRLAATTGILRRIVRK